MYLLNFRGGTYNIETDESKMSLLTNENDIVWAWVWYIIDFEYWKINHITLQLNKKTPNYMQLKEIVLEIKD